MFRSAMFALAALAGFVALPANAETSTSARCEEMSFRVYFDHGSATLSEDATRMLEIAERNVAECGYAELHVTVDASSSLAAQRGDAIMSAVSGRGWDVARVEPMRMTQATSYGAPEFAAVTMTPRVMPETAPLTTNHAGV